MITTKKGLSIVALYCFFFQVTKITKFKIFNNNKIMEQIPVIEIVGEMLVFFETS
jgi:hypothetical protein